MHWLAIGLAYVLVRGIADRVYFAVYGAGIPPAGWLALSVPYFVGLEYATRKQESFADRDCHEPDEAERAWRDQDRFKDQWTQAGDEYRRRTFKSVFGIHAPTAVLMALTVIPMMIDGR